MPSAVKPVYGVVVTSAGVGTVHCSSGVPAAIADVGKEVRAKAIAANAERTCDFFIFSQPLVYNLPGIWMY